MSNKVLNMTANMAHNIINMFDDKTEYLTENEYLQVCNSLKNIHFYESTLDNGTYVSLNKASVGKEMFDILIYSNDVRVNKKFETSIASLKHLENYVLDLPIPVITKKIKHYCLQKYFNNKFNIEQLTEYENKFKKDHLYSFLRGFPYYMNKLSKNRVNQFYILTYLSPLSLAIEEYMNQESCIRSDMIKFAKQLIKTQTSMNENMCILKKTKDKLSHVLTKIEKNDFDKYIDKILMSDDDMFFVKVDDFNAAVKLLQMYDTDVRDLRKQHFQNINNSCCFSKKLPCFSFNKKKAFLAEFCKKHSICYNKKVESKTELKEFEQYLAKYHLKILIDSLISKTINPRQTKVCVSYLFRTFYLENIETEYKQFLQQKTEIINKMEKSLEVMYNNVYNSKIKII